MTAGAQKLLVSGALRWAPFWPSGGVTLARLSREACIASFPCIHKFADTHVCFERTIDRYNLVPTPSSFLRLDCQTPTVIIKLFGCCQFYVVRLLVFFVVRLLVFKGNGSRHIIRAKS